MDDAVIATSCRQGTLWSYNCPRLFLIGAQKAGTTTFASWVRSNPNVRFGRNNTMKEMHFFTHLVFNPPSDVADLRLKARRYVQSFGERTSQETVGMDCTPDYLAYPDVPRLMRESGVANDRTRFLVMLRDPVDRFISSLNMILKIEGRNRTVDDVYFPTGMPTENKTESVDIQRFAFAALEHTLACRTLAEPSRRGEACAEYFERNGVGRSSILARGLYVDQLHSWLNYFEPRQICIIDSTFFHANPAAATRRRAQRCLNDVGLRVDDLPIEAKPENVGKYKFSVDDVYPEMRKRLNDELFEGANRELRQLLEQKWGINDFEL
eukprot:Plantae.Rhodophyta-Rhodochaete_pulchella.ctg6832.p1 GENE.Plantae.Rhodophyta-Rhodochaete_pulchella.ctg6832~~Plantae.Rhodophyta-Rhodochaete_pulchella.ctg6832.p1  ORF type:complete len:324 (-),score=40.18 Plantae.Rhodophyta-Rhodochaete_pulchella.ctg6832:659-1630(-)